MDRYCCKESAVEGAVASPPSGARQFARALLGESVPNLSRPKADARAKHEQVQWLAEISPRHANRPCDSLREEADVTAQRAQLEWLASISPRHESQLQRLLTTEAKARDARGQTEQLVEYSEMHEAHWDPAKHPRLGGPPNAGWFATTGGAGGSGGRAGRLDRAGTNGEPESVGKHGVPHEMLELASAWWQTDGLLRQYRRSIERLPTRIRIRREQAGRGGRYADIHKRNLAKAKQDLETAKVLVPQLDAQLRALEKKYRDSGFDEIPYATWTPGETVARGRGIEQVAHAVRMGGSPAGLKPTGIEFDIALGAASVLQLGKAALQKALTKTPRKVASKAATIKPYGGAARGLKSSAAASRAPKLPTFTKGGKTTGVVRTPTGDIPILSGRAGPAASLPKRTPGFNAITSTHVEGHAAAIMRQKGIQDASVYINNPRICLPCQQNLAHMLPSGSRLTVVFPNGSSTTFIGNAR